MSTPLTLETVQAEFQQWRQQRTSRRAKVPDELRAKVLALRASVKPSQLIKALGINSSMIKNWTGEPCSGAKKSAAQQTAFVPLPIDIVSTASPNASSLSTTVPGCIELCCDSANGSQWRLSGQCTREQLSAFIHALQSTTGVKQ